MMHHLTTIWADLIGAAFTALLLLAFGALGGGDPWGLGKAGVLSQKPHGTKVEAPIRAMLMGKDGRLSTSKVAAFCWTIVIIYVLSTAAAIAIVEQTSYNDLLSGLSDSYLLLLGGPFAALVLAKGITVTRLNNGSLAKPAAEKPQISLSDLVSDDSGQTDLVDFQFLMFNALALAYVLVSFSGWPHRGLPDLPTAFAGLTSVSALTYTANKAIAGSTPTITAASYDSATGVITVSGQNLGGAGASIRFDGVATAVLDASANRISIKVPTGSALGKHTISVSVPSGTGLLSVNADVDLPAVAP